LLAGFVHANLRIVGIVRQVVDRNDIFHIG
jgi:hypothetical protein